MRIVAVIPAYNEEDNIEQLIQDLISQSFPLEKIIIIADNCNDNTVFRVRSLQKEFSNLYCIETVNNKHRKAGAINFGLDYLDDDYELVLIMDSDSRIASDLIENAIKSFEKNPMLGGVCSTAQVLKPKSFSGSWLRKIEANFLWILQRLEYAGFDAERTATWGNVTVLHGLCGVYRLKALQEVGGYALNHLIEDYDLTLKIKEAGWDAFFNPKMRAWTEIPMTFRDFFRQRLRWLRGGTDVLLDHGINKFTAEDVFHHFLFILLFVAIFGFVFISNLYGNWNFKLNPHPIPIAVMILGYTMGLYKLRFLEDVRISDIFVRAVILPELIMAIAMMGVRFYAYYLAIFSRPQKW